MMKMWCLINKNSGKVIKIAVGTPSDDCVYAIGFETKKGLLVFLDGVVEDDEEVKRVDFAL